MSVINAATFLMGFVVLYKKNKVFLFLELSFHMQNLLCLCLMPLLDIL